MNKSRTSLFAATLAMIAAALLGVNPAWAGSLYSFSGTVTRWGIYLNTSGNGSYCYMEVKPTTTGAPGAPVGGMVQLFSHKDMCDLAKDGKQVVANPDPIAAVSKPWLTRSPVYRFYVGYSNRYAEEGGYTQGRGDMSWMVYTMDTAE